MDFDVGFMGYTRDLALPAGLGKMHFLSSQHCIGNSVDALDDISGTSIERSMMMHG
jgi:hypothetical protein